MRRGEDTGRDAVAIRELDAHEDGRAFPLLRQLHEGLERSRFEELVAEMRGEGYHLFGAFDGDDLVGVAGSVVLTNFSNGRFVYLYDLVVDTPRRREGIGAALVEHVHDWARERGCSRVSLFTGAPDDAVDAFYVGELGYDRKGPGFKKML